MSFIFVTGGVVSSLGKGLTAASIGAILESRGLRVAMMKLDPYLNVDPGTMNPSQHGEVYVLDDGSETDLDLGHYERMTSLPLSRANNVTSGQVYLDVIERERKGDYLGQTIQVIPHITDEIKRRVVSIASKNDCDILIVEIGGTTGDIEGLPHLEAIRQLKLATGTGRSIVVHLTLLPYLRAAGEMKTKPTQQSVAKLREIGLSPDILVCRSEHPVDEDSRKKISLFCNVPVHCVIDAPDVSNTVYEVPSILHEQNLDSTICQLLGISPPKADLGEWSNFVQRATHPTKNVSIAVVGKYTSTKDAYKSIDEALLHAGASLDCGVTTHFVDSEDVTRDNVASLLGGFDGILIPGGFGIRGIDGKVAAVEFARTHNVPFFGICLGLQIAVIEAARNLLGIASATSQEFDQNSDHPVIHFMEDQKALLSKGGTMRLGAYPLSIVEGTTLASLYASLEGSERHRHRYEVNSAYLEQLKGAGFFVSAFSPDGSLVEAIEIPGHPFFLACQFHPEFQSKPLLPHPLFLGFLRAAISRHEIMSPAA